MSMPQFDWPKLSVFRLMSQYNRLLYSCRFYNCRCCGCSYSVFEPNLPINKINSFLITERQTVRFQIFWKKKKEKKMQIYLDYVALFFGPISLFLDVSCSISLSLLVKESASSLISLIIVLTVVSISIAQNDNQLVHEALSSNRLQQL